MLRVTQGQFHTVAAMVLRATAERALATRRADMLHQVVRAFWDHLALLQQLREFLLLLQLHIRLGEVLSVTALILAELQMLLTAAIMELYLRLELVLALRDIVYPVPHVFWEVLVQSVVLVPQALIQRQCRDLRFLNL